MSPIRSWRSLFATQLSAKLKTAQVEVKTGNLHAGTKCCSADPDLHNVSLVVPYKQAEPTFRDDFTIPWEGKRMMEAVRKAAAKMPKGAPVTLEVRVSEGPEERIEDQAAADDMLKQAGASQTDVTVLCTYKSGYSWLVDEIEPMLKEKGRREDQDRIRALSRPRQADDDAISLSLEPGAVSGR